MILLWLIIVPALGGLLGWLLDHWNRLWSRWLVLVAMLAELALTLVAWRISPGPMQFTGGGIWFLQLDVPWIPQLGVRFHLAMDGLSFWMVLLTAFLGLIALVGSWKDVTEQTGFFHLNLSLLLAGVVGVFLALDLFLFYFFWELMLVPMYFLIVIWGDENRRYAGTKFFLFTQLSGLLMLVAILALFFIHGRNTGEYTFDYGKLLHTNLPPGTAMWLLLGFVAAFLVKLPAVPLHSWLPEAYTSSPTAGSVLLAGLLSKTGAYGLLRFVIPLFPQAASQFASVAMILGVFGILYGALMAFAQTDLKRFIAYTSVSHLGFVLLGIFAWNQLALQGVVAEMLCHGLSIGGLFLLAGMLEERLHTRDLRRMGGLWAVVPRLGAVTMIFALASLGLPGLGNFVGEFLILLGSFQANPGLTAAATVGLVGAVIYALWMTQLILHGTINRELTLPDLKVRELGVLALLVLALLWIGLYPQPVLNTAGPALEGLRRAAQPVREARSPEPEIGRKASAGLDPSDLAFGPFSRTSILSLSP
ncbi:MAG TPA: NADH-quinone oxidoreductase subunit M [Terriglobia bacterium]|nr:NADH-quinone oxidoreductase subunit M [Terriglobia bacterium]